MLNEFKHYFAKAKMKMEQKFEGAPYTDEDIGDDLINKIPIYDTIYRKYAAFSSFPEAIKRKRKDPKGNGIRFESNSIPSYDFLFLCYLFRLCGSGINYKSDHGFGNFWIVEMVHQGFYRHERWLENIPQKSFSDSKGYLLPMIPKGLRNFIIEDSKNLVDEVLNEIYQGGYDLIDGVNLGNHWLRSRGYKRQNFVLTAWLMDIIEYTDLIPKDSDVLVGSNAKKCLKLIFPNQKIDANKALQILIDETGNCNYAYDMEDVACDFIRYIENFQSADHIKQNNGIIYRNSLPTM